MLSNISSHICISKLTFIIFVGVDLISGVSCDAPYEWTEQTDTEWEFSETGKGGEKLHVCIFCP